MFTVAPRYDQYRDAWDTSVRVSIEGNDDVGFFHTEDKVCVAVLRPQTKDVHGGSCSMLFMQQRTAATA